MNKENLQNALAQHYGSMTRSYLSLPCKTFDICSTEGIKCLAENAGNGAFWLLDLIGSHQRTIRNLCTNTDAKLRADGEMLRDFQVWNIAMEDRIMTVTCIADTDHAPVVTQRIEYTDFPLDELTIYVERDGRTETSMTMMLTSER